MKQQYVHYPIFSSGEVLTKDLLENIANYSDEQGRITRSQFLGYGIISGLNYKFENNFLTISPGVALTASGNIICIGSETVYKYMEKMDDGLFKLTETNTAKSVKLRYSSSCVLAIRYEREDEKAYKCSEDSCDLNNIRKHIRFTPYLVPIDLVEKPSAFDEGLKEYMHLYRFNDVAFSLVTNFLHDNVRECFYKNSVKVISKLKDLDNRLANKKSSLGFLFSVDYVFNEILEPHQQIRIKVSLGLEDDPSGAGYNVNQSKIAIGSGGLSGKGFLNGTQTKLKYVPEQDTDFIFCTVGEEQGFVGSVSVLLLFGIFILRLIALAERQDHAFGRVYGYSVASIFFFHLAINIGMVTGLTPVIGIPLPFFSYGGSSLWGFTILLFIFLRLDASRKER